STISLLFFFFFFFQAEDGIRDRTVTGVQTCALPILKQTQAKTTLSEHFQSSCCRAVRLRPSLSVILTTGQRRGSISSAPIPCTSLQPEADMRSTYTSQIWLQRR